MKLRRLSIALTVTAVTLLVAAQSALADNGGQGWYGETTDKAITNVMFGVILFFPAVICLFSFIQWRLDKRKHARMAAEKRRAASADWRGGW
jgi:heme/copper-type cytochrome/quinol oxidase subunit 2